jgi:hypothetical protein
MLLENTGIRLELENPVDIARHKALGWQEVKPMPEQKKEEKPAEKQAGKKAVKNEL